MRNINNYLLIIIILASSTVAMAQTKPLSGQYFQNLPAHAPALTGANDFLDIRFAVRQQWAQFEGAPSSVFLSGYSPLKTKRSGFQYQNMRINSQDEPTRSTISLKHGVGGYLQSNEQDQLKQLKVNLNYAVHVPVFKRTFLSFGISAGFSNERIDISNINVKNEIDDVTYQSLLNNGSNSSRITVAGGLALNSDRYYVAYSILPLVEAYVSGNEQLTDNEDHMRHQVAFGHRFFLSQDVELIPNGFVRLEAVMPILFDAGLRVRYQQKYWAGLSYRNDGSLITMLGLTVNDRWNFSYSYEYGMSDFHRFNNGTHEVVLGVQLFNFNSYVPVW